MATIYNSNLSKELVEGAKLQTSRDMVPSQIADKVVPVMEVNPSLLRRVNFYASGGATNATSATLATTSSTMDTYLLGASISLIKDVTSTSTLSRILFTDEFGVQQQLLPLSGITLTVQNENATMSFPLKGIKLQRGSTITVTNGTNVANIKATAAVWGYTIENPNA